VDLKERLNQDLKEAMRARDRLRADTLRLALTAIRRAEVARTDPRHPQHGQPLTEADLLALLEKEVKSREEAVALYRQGGREDLAAKEEAEIAILRQYLPRPLTREEIAAEVARIIAEVGHDFRAVMPRAAQALKGRAEGRVIQEVVRELVGRAERAG